MTRISKPFSDRPVAPDNPISAEKRLKSYGFTILELPRKDIGRWYKAKVEKSGVVGWRWVRSYINGWEITATRPNSCDQCLVMERSK